MIQPIMQRRILLLSNCLIFLAVATLWVIYLVFGQRWIETLYTSEWNEFLHRILMMDGHRIRPIEDYVQRVGWLMESTSIVAFLVAIVITMAMTGSSQLILKILTPLFMAFAVLVSAVVFFYPLEIETRESTVWLHVLALQHGINIYDHAQVAFINQNHGPLDPLFKLAIATVFPFFEPWQVARFAVLLLPYAFLFFAWRLLRNLPRRSTVEVVFLGISGYLLLIVSAKEFILVGRSDATAALLLLLLIYFSMRSTIATSWAGIRHGVLWGSLATLAILTNWRMIPAVLALLFFNLWTQRYKEKTPLKNTALYLGGSACAALAICVPLLIYFFETDGWLYYRHFFGVYSAASGHGHRTYAHAPAIWFLGSLLKPFASPDNLKGGPVLLSLAIYFCVPAKMSFKNMAWLALGCAIFAACTATYYLNYYGGGQWYYMPFLVILWCFLCANYREMGSSGLARVGLVLLLFIVVNYNTVVTPTLWRATTVSQAFAFMHELRSVAGQYRLVSEDSFFYRTSYQGELIDMGDMVSRIRKKGTYYGEQFNATVDRHFERLRADQPDYIVTGFTESPELRRLIDEHYQLVDRGPGNFTANGRGETQLFKRNYSHVANGSKPPLADFVLTQSSEAQSHR
jgi:hypothetical protein